MNKKTLLAASALALVLALGCASAPKEVPAKLSVSELVQRAQEASDHYDDATAIAYYQAAMDRFGSDEGVLCMGEYEIGFIYYKEAKYAEAKALLTKLVARYEGPDAASLPPRYLILANKVLPKIEAALPKPKN